MGFLGSGWGNIKGGTRTDYIVGASVAGIIGAGYATYKLAGILGETQTQEAIQKASVTGVAGISALLAGGLIGAGLKVYQELKTTPVKALKITPREGAKINSEKVWQMTYSLRSLYMKRIWNKRKWLRWRIESDEQGNITFKVIVPAEELRNVEARVKRAFPDCVVSEASPEISLNLTGGYVTHLTLSEKHDPTMGLRNDRKNVIGDALYLLPDESVFEVTFSPSSIKSIKRGVKRKIKKLRKENGRDAESYVKRAKERIGAVEGVERTAFTCYFDVWSKRDPSGFIGELSAATEKNGSKLQGRPYRFLIKQRNPLTMKPEKRQLMMHQSNKLTDTELSSFLMLPAPGHPVWDRIETAIPRPKVEADDFQGDYGVGYIDSDDPEQDGRVARLKIKTFTNHGLIAGASGGGKGSTLGMIAKLDYLKDWVTNPDSAMGMTISDPHGTTLYLYINHLLELERQGYEVPWDRVKCVSFGSQGMYEYPVAMNILHMFEGEEIDKVATDVEDVILSAFNSANMSKGVSDLQRALQVILRKEEASIADINTLFKASDRARRMRQDILNNENFDNYAVREWLLEAHQQIEQSGKDLTVSSIDTRLASLTTKKGIQRLLCRKGNYFNVKEILAEGNLVLIDFLGAEPETYKLIAGWLSKKYFDESQKRGEGGRPHLLVFDEVQKFNVSDIFADIIRENRKFNMGLLLVTQMISKLDDELAETITSNAGFIISVRQEAGAAGMQRLLGKPFTADELTRLEPGLEAAIKSHDGVARLKLDYPQFLLNGKPTWKDSAEEKEAINTAKAKFKELLARDHKPASEADQEVAEVFGLVTEKEQDDNVVPFGKKPESGADREETGRRVVRRG
jgi:hypothetical protein